MLVSGRVTPLPRNGRHRMPRRPWDKMTSPVGLPFATDTELGKKSGWDVEGCVGCFKGPFGIWIPKKTGVTSVFVRFFLIKGS